MEQQQTSALTRYNFLQDWIGLIALLGMVFGFMCSRAVLSISMIVLLANSLWPLQLKLVWTRWRRNWFALSCAGYFLLNFIGGLWSTKQDVWLDVVVLHLPFIALPIGMHTTPLCRLLFRKRFLTGLYAIIGGVVLISLATFFSNMEVFIEGYNHSKQIPTNEENDHIRFSLFLALSLLPGYAYLQKDYKIDQDRPFQIFVLSTMALIIFYLHILSAKTGLAALYLLFGLALFDFFYKKGYKIMSVLGPPVIVAVIFVLGYFGSGTMRNKVDYVVYEIQQIAAGQRLDYNYSDAGRIISYQMAWQGIRDNPIVGTGTGDVWSTMRSNYREFYPEVPEANQLIPHSQYLYTLLGFGILFFPIFILMVIAPFFNKKYEVKFFPWATATILILAMMAEAMLQVQHGVFVFLLFNCLWFNWKFGNT